MGMVVIGAVFVDIKGYPTSAFIPTGRNAGRVEQIHGGVGRNVAEDIANCELRPTFVSLVDDSGTGVDVVRKLKSHRVNTDYIRKTRNGMGTWLAVFNDDGDVAASISQRPNLLPIAHTLEQDGDEIFQNADSVVIEIDMDKGNRQTHLPAGAEVWKACLCRGGEYEHCVGKTGFPSVHGLLCLQSAGGGNPVFR